MARALDSGLMSLGLRSDGKHIAMLLTGTKQD